MFSHARGLRRRCHLLAGPITRLIRAPPSSGGCARTDSDARSSAWKRSGGEEAKQAVASPSARLGEPFDGTGTGFCLRHCQRSFFPRDLPATGRHPRHGVSERGEGDVHAKSAFGRAAGRPQGRSKVEITTTGVKSLGCLHSRTVCHGLSSSLRTLEALRSHDPRAGAVLCRHARRARPRSVGRAGANTPVISLQ